MTAPKLVRAPDCRTCGERGAARGDSLDCTRCLELAEAVRKGGEIERTIKLDRLVGYAALSGYFVAHKTYEPPRWLWRRHRAWRLDHEGTMRLCLEFARSYFGSAEATRFLESAFAHRGGPPALQEFLDEMQAVVNRGGDR